MEELAIGEVARRAGIQASALRYYESIGLLPAARRVNGQRRSAASIVQRLAVIRLAQQAGFRVAEIQTLLGFAAERAPVERWQPLVERKLAELDAQIALAQQRKRLLQRLGGCDCATLEQCASRL